MKLLFSQFLLFLPNITLKLCAFRLLHYLKVSNLFSLVHEYVHYLTRVVSKKKSLLTKIVGLVENSLFVSHKLCRLATVECRV